MGRIVKDKGGNVYKYDSNNNEIHYRDSNGFEYWYTYDSDNKFIKLHYPNLNIQETLWKK